MAWTKLRPLLWLMVLVLLAGCGGPVALIVTPTPVPTLYAVSTVRVACPESLVPAVRTSVSDFQKSQPQVEVTVLSRADALAFRSLQQGDAEVAVLTWLPASLPEGAWIQPVARDALAIVVHPQNGLPGVTLAQLQDLYEGQVEDWAPWGGLPGAPQLVSREASSGASSFFQAWVMRDARVSLNALMAPSSEAVLQFVGSDPLAVGYVSNAWLDERVRALAVDGVPPAQEALVAGLYPLTRTLFLATLEAPEGAARGVVQWLLEDPGQKVFEAYGFAPPPK
ncbi:MAG: substrate-binding domain-containing protein [Anaerolineae bacterium]